MRSAFLSLAILTCAPAAFAQAPPAAPAPPPAPVVPALPLLPDVGLLHEDALRAAEEAAQNIDVDAIRRQVEVAKADVKAQAAQLEAQAREWAESWELHRDHLWDLHDSSFQVPLVAARVGRLDRSPYSSGLTSLQRRQYEQAIARFDQVIETGETHMDGALYWKAYAQYKLGQTDEALATIVALRQAHPQSRYLNDARVLEADARQSSGQPLTGDNDDDEIKLLAISGLQHSNPEGAVPLLDNVLKATNSLQVKKRALFVLAQNDQPAAHQLLVGYAKGAGNPDLQLEAIRYLVARRQQTTGAELQEIYGSTADRDVRLAVIAALGSAGDAEALVALARAETSNDLKVQIVRRLSAIAGKNETAANYLMELIR